MMISRLHYITQDHPVKSHGQLAKEACEGGVDWIQIRLKNKSHDEVREIAAEIKKVGQEFGAVIILNDYPEIALELGLHGVHLGKEDMSPLEARALLGPDLIIGGTANTWEDILFLIEAGVDYIGLGPFRFTNTKTKLSPVLGLEGYEKIMTHLRSKGEVTPVIAIGGILQEDVADLFHTGIDGIAIAGAIGMQTSLQVAASNFLEIISNQVKAAD